MIYKVCIAFFSIWISALVQTGTPGMPLIPADGVPLAQIFDTQVTDSTIYNRHNNKVYFIWGAERPYRQEGIVAGKYFPSMRNPDPKLNLEWYQQHHPDWIMYQEDRKTPAYRYIYSYGGLVPLDISNPEVRAWYLDTFILPAVRQGYRMVAMDNVDLGNWPKSAGHFSGGQWVPLYTGKKDDTAFHRAVIGWMQFLSDKLHPLGVQVCANIKATTAPTEVILQVMDAVDMWLDETGFTHTGKNITDKAWEKSFALLQKITLSKACVSINQVNGPVATASTDQVEWVIGNFLLSRGPQSLLAIVGFDKKAVYHRFDYREEMNVNIGAPAAAPQKDNSGAWIRKYSKGMVLVNASSQAAARVALPKGKWKTLHGAYLEQEITLQPASAAVLAKE